MSSLPATRRLDQDDSWRTRFEATVIAHAKLQARPSVILDESAFYPESGGQLPDRGTLAGFPVVDVQIDEAGVVHHVLGGALPAVGTRVAGEVDRSRRRVHMALHTGQHMLSRAFLDVANAQTASSRLGETACTIDLSVPSLAERDAAEAEALVNAVIDDDLAIRAYFPSEAELASITLRRAPKVEKNIRVVQIGEFDVSPCGGTHCTRTAQVGLTRITGIERYKGMMRVTFSSGPRARAEVLQFSGALGEMARTLTCGPAEVVAAVEKLRKDLGDARETLGGIRVRMAKESAEELVGKARADGRSVVVALLAGADIDTLRVIGKRIASETDLACVLGAPVADGIHLLATRGTHSTFDCGVLVKRTTAAAGGRGGGRPTHAEGKLPAGVDFNAVVGAALA